MDKLELSVIEAIITGEAFNEGCGGDNHSAICDTKEALNASRMVKSKLIEILQTHIDDPGTPGEVYLEFFAAGFVVATEYFAIKGLEATVVTTVPGSGK